MSFCLLGISFIQIRRQPWIYHFTAVSTFQKENNANIVKLQSASNFQQYEILTSLEHRQDVWLQKGSDTVLVDFLRDLEFCCFRDQHNYYCCHSLRRLYSPAHIRNVGRKNLTIFKGCHYSRLFIMISLSFRKIETKNLNSDPLFQFSSYWELHHQLHISYLSTRSDCEIQAASRRLSYFL